jgi:hypothetical protein
MCTYLFWTFRPANPEAFPTAQVADRQICAYGSIISIGQVLLEK